MSGQGYIEAEKPQQCDLCGKIEELRPYGPKGEMVCFACGMKDGAAAKAAFRKRVLGDRQYESPIRNTEREYFPGVDDPPCPVKHPRGYRCSLPAGHEGNHQVLNQHHCHARGCGTPTKPEMLMCFRHWRMVPKAIQRAVWTAYRQGQCDDKRPSEAWHKAADDAILAVYKKEKDAARPPGDGRSA